jgi:hypothetical protein
MVVKFVPWKKKTIIYSREKKPKQVCVTAKLRQIFIPKYVFEVNHEVNHGV